ncbi:MAG TPA: chromosome segregation protein SMC [Ruminococcaceae bacterium]|nr:chromosome segregation protein SMC [Oscillospiraceae bacterium]
MFLKGLEIQGFKSFPDKTKLNFGSGITAVVGPNGSGKSNISDAVRWVLGEQSTKSLRSSKMEDVVFGGTLKRRALGYAEVTLIIDNRDRALDFENDELAITRRYYRSGESEYQINRATVRLRDLHELFMDTGLGRDGYSMIGQGKIDSIVASKSGERRDIFEEAAGISRFRYRKLEAERKQAQAEENLIRLRDILSELESRVEPLREQSEKASQFLKMSEEKRELEIGLWLHQLERSKEQLREQDYKITLSQARHEQTEKELLELEADMLDTEEQTQQLAVQIDSVRREASAAEEHARGAESDIAVRKNDILHNEENISRLERDIAHCLAGEQEIEAEIEARRAEILTLEEFIAERRGRLEQSGGELERIVSEDAAQSSKKEALGERLALLTNRLSEEKVKSVTAESSLAEISARRLTVQDTIHQLKEQLERLNEEEGELQKDTVRLKEHAEECGNAVKGYELRVKSRQESCRTAKEEIDHMLLEVKSQQRRAQILEELEKNLEGFAASVKSVMKQAKDGGLTGIHGPLSRLIKVEPGYATAVEVALGANMQNIVVATQGDAKRAIQFLKERKAGRGTFMPINAMKGKTLYEAGLESRQGYIGIAADLVDCSPEYRDIVRFAIGRVVVAEDLDCAVAIARQYDYRFRIVTLDGQLVNAGGSMTGGSLAKGAGLLGRTAEIGRIRKEAIELERKAGEKQARYLQLTQELAAAEAEVKNAAAELSIAQEDSIRVEGEKRRVLDHIGLAENQLTQLKSEKDTIKDRVEELERVKSACAAQTARLTEEADALEAQLETLTGSRDTLAGRREELLHKNAEIRLEISGAEKDIENRQSGIVEMSSRKAGQSDRAGELRGEIDSIKARIEASNAEIIELGKRSRLLRESASEHTAEITRLSALRIGCEQSLVKLRVSEKEKLSEREKIALELARLQERRDVMLTGQDDIIKKLYDEYELTRSEAEETGISVSDPQAANKRLYELRSKIKALGSVNVAAIEEYKEVYERYTFMKGQITDIETAKQELAKLIEELTAKMREMFSERFEQINRHFSATFVDLFGGGTAELKLTNPEDVLESGIEILAQPPGKNVAIIEQLSGGEKALIAVSVYFAIMKVNPPPFCMLDEVEAALDEVNVVRFAEYLRRMSGKTQFIVITHRRGTMEEADMLYGVTMQEKGVSKLLELNVTQVEEQKLLVAN